MLSIPEEVFNTRFGIQQASQSRTPPAGVGGGARAVPDRACRRGPAPRAEALSAVRGAAILRDVIDKSTIREEVQG